MTNGNLLATAPLQSRRCGAPDIIAELAGVALVTQIGTWPLTASAFLVIAAYASLANALVVPVAGVAMLVGFVELAVSSVPLLGVAMLNVERSLVGWIVGVVRYVGVCRMPTSLRRRRRSVRSSSTMSP